MEQGVAELKRGGNREVGTQEGIISMDGTSGGSRTQKAVARVWLKRTPWVQRVLGGEKRKNRIKSL